MPRREKTGVGILVASLTTLVGVVIYAFAANSKHVQPLLVAEAIIFLFPLGAGAYAVAFVAVRLLENLLSARGGVFQIMLAGFLPALLPVILMHNDRDMYQYLFGMLPGGFLGAAVAFWPQKPEEFGERGAPEA